MKHRHICSLTQIFFFLSGNFFRNDVHRYCIKCRLLLSVFYKYYVLEIYQTNELVKEWLNKTILYNGMRQLQWEKILVQYVQHIKKSSFSVDDKISHSQKLIKLIMRYIKLDLDLFHKIYKKETKRMIMATYLCMRTTPTSTTVTIPKQTLIVITAVLS